MAVETESRVAADPQGTAFSLNGTPLLSSGRSNQVVAHSDDMTVTVKVYAEGGENALHTHQSEDHSFFVLAGQATFHLGKEDRVVVVNRYEGVLLPKGAFYRFESTGKENLVLYRVGAKRLGGDDRLGVDGKPLPGGSKENHNIPPTPVPGKFFGA